MEFFESLPRPEPPPRPARPRPPRWMRPDGVVPAPLPFARLLVHTPRLAVFVAGLAAYPEGFGFTVHVRRPREEEPGRRRGHRHEYPFGRHLPFEADEDPEAGRRLLRFGVLFADGRRAAADGHRPLLRPAEGEPEPEPPMMVHQSGHGGDGHWDQEIWVWGLPPSGPVSLFYSWAAEGVGESSLPLDGDGIRRGAARAVVLWPEASETEGAEGTEAPEAPEGPVGPQPS